jgi:hypothetical protein
MTAHHLGMWRYYRQHMLGNVLVDTLTAVGIGLRLGVHAVSYAARSTFERLPRQQRP